MYSQPDYPERNLDCELEQRLEDAEEHDSKVRDFCIDDHDCETCIYIGDNK